MSRLGISRSLTATTIRTLSYRIAAQRVDQVCFFPGRYIGQLCPGSPRW